ncbi:MAG: prefoldin subunit alpha [Candidatus Woesearchaeota archaeon]
MDQDKYQQMQILEYQIKQLQKVIESIDSQLGEIKNTVDALREFDKLEGNEEILFPIANGIFAKGRLNDDKNLRINIGSDINVEKSISDTIRMMDNQSKDIENYRAEINVQLEKFQEKIIELQR